MVRAPIKLVSRPGKRPRTAQSLSPKQKLGWRSPAACAALTAVAGLLCLGDPWRSWFERVSYDLPFLFAPKGSFADVIVVERDQKSYDELIQKYDQKWDRSLYARLLDKLTADAAKLVVFDIFLDDPGTKETDDLLAGAIRTNGSVVLAADYQESKRLSGGQPSFPLDLFRRSAKETGLSLVYFDPADRGARQIHPGDEDHPSLPWVAAQLAGAQLPSQADRLTPRWLNYPKTPDSLRRISFSDALIQQPNYFRNLYVFVGGAPNIKLQWEKVDEFSTPLSRWGEKRQSGVVIHALAFENLLRGDWLIRPSPATEYLLVLVTGMILGAVLAWLKPWAATGVGVMAAVLLYVGACELMFARHVWLPWLIAAGAQVPVALCWSILAHSKRLMREKEMAVNQLDREREIVDRLLPQAEPGDGTIRLPAKASGDGHAPEVAPAGAAATAEGANGKWAPPSVPDHTLVRCIGEGAYGQVWLASDIIGTFHAVKFVYRSAFVNAAPFDREFRGIQRFTPISRSHPGFVNILHVGRNEVGGYFYYIMELGDDENQGQKIVPETYSAK